MNKKLVKWLLVSGAGGILIALAVVLYIFNKPHRDVQGSAVDYEISADALVQEYLEDAEKSNLMYLSEDGDSKILLVQGTINNVDQDLKNNIVLTLKSANSSAGVSCTFQESTNERASLFAVGQTVKVKGVIRSGAGYDEDLELYEDVIMEKCDILN